MSYYQDLRWSDIDPDDYVVGTDGHCPGPGYRDAKGCGRFLARGASLCASCEALFNNHLRLQAEADREDAKRWEESERKYSEWAAREGLQERDILGSWEAQKEDLPF